MARSTRKDKAAAQPPRSFALGHWMAKLGVSDEDLADKVGCRRESVWRWQTGERQPTKGMIPKIAKALGLQVADLFRTSDHISFDIAGAHITSPEQREIVARLLRAWPKS